MLNVDTPWILTFMVKLRLSSATISPREKRAMCENITVADEEFDIASRTIYG
jgi:hypothetical protein